MFSMVLLWCSAALQVLSRSPKLFGVRLTSTACRVLCLLTRWIVPVRTSCELSRRSRSVWVHTPVPIQMAIGAEENFKGQIDLIKMKAIYWNDADKGMTLREEEIPAELQGLAEEWRANMIEAAAEATEELMNKYLEGEELTKPRSSRLLRQRTIAGEIVLAVCGSSFKNKGVPLVLDAVIDYLPAPVEIPPSRVPMQMTRPLLWSVMRMIKSRFCSGIQDCY